MDSENHFSNHARKSFSWTILGFRIFGSTTACPQVIFVSAILQHFSFLIRLRLQQHPGRQGIDYIWNHYQVAGFTHSWHSSKNSSSESSASTLRFLEIQWRQIWFNHRRRNRHMRHWKCQTRRQNRLRFVQIVINKLFWLYFEHFWRSRLNSRLQWAPHWAAGAAGLNLSIW